VISGKVYSFKSTFISEGNCNEFIKIFTLLTIFAICSVALQAQTTTATLAGRVTARVSALPFEARRLKRRTGRPESRKLQRP
jgi:hypothetical protein